MVSRVAIQVTLGLNIAQMAATAASGGNGTDPPLPLKSTLLLSKAKLCLKDTSRLLTFLLSGRDNSRH